METVNKYVTAASTAIWGQNGEPNATQITQQHGEEPLSGVQGRGDTTDPYDAGNRDGKCTKDISRVQKSSSDSNIK